MEHTLNNAVLTLLGVCDGATSLDGQGFNGRDVNFARSIGEQIKSGRQLTFKQQDIVYSILKKYSKQLSNFDIDYSQIPKPQEQSFKSLPENNFNFENFVKNLKFDSGKEVIARGIKTLLQIAPQPENWCQVWSNYKDKLKELGISTSKDRNTGEWQVVKWTTLKPEESKESINIDQINLKFPELLLPYQRDHVRQLITSIKNHNAVLDASDTGVGKTYSALSVCKELDLFPIIITPKPVVSIFRKIMEQHFKLDGFVLNYEQFKINNTKFLHCEKVESVKNGVKQLKEIYEWNVPENGIIIFDEVHKCKNQKTQNAAILVQAKKQGIKLLMMSATVGHNPIHMYAVGTAIDLFQKNKFFYWMMNHGVYQGQFGLEYRGGIDSLKKIHDEIFPAKGSRISIKDLGDQFPETLILPECYDMNGNEKEIRKVYEQMQEELNNLYQKSEKDKGGSILTEMLRARQKVELLKVPTFVELVKNHLEEGNAVAIFVNYNETVIKLAKLLNAENNIIWGSNKKGERELVVNAFQKNQINVVICNINAGGVGISLHDPIGDKQRVSLISPDWSAESLKQALGRVHRAGGAKSIQKIIFCKDTIEEGICENVKRKIDNLSTINDGDLTGTIKI